MSPRLLLLVDGLGALLSATLLKLLPDIGIPAQIMTALALSATVMAAYSLTCCLSGRTAPGYLRAVARANTLYCLATVAIMVHYRASLSWLGIAYFVTEIFVVSQLIRLESQASGA